MRSHLLLLVFGAACGTEMSDFELDRDAAESIDGKADTITFTRLERATPAQVAASIEQVHGKGVAACFAAYKSHYDGSATYLTAAVADKFVGICEDWATNGEVVKGVLRDQGLTMATLATVLGGISVWAKPQLEATAADGFVNLAKAPLTFYDDILRVQDGLAGDRERDPSGIDLAKVRWQWKRVREDSTLDRAYLNPVTFSAGALDSDQVFHCLRAAFPLHGLTLSAAASSAVDTFATAHEGPDNDPAFGPIATAFKKGSIKKRFYFAGTGEGWSSNVLIVIDDHAQAYGMQMGYSE